MTTTILLVEDHEIVRKGLRRLLELESDFKVLGEATNGLEGIKLAERLKPIVVIMDIAMPKLNGIEASRIILKKIPKTKIIVLSAYTDQGYLDQLSEIGVSGYLQKHCSPSILVQAIRYLEGNKRFFYPESLGSSVSASRKKQSLSERQMQVLQLIAEGSGNKQIASELEISIKTVEKHRQALMKKLRIHEIAGLTRYAIASGVIRQ